MCGHVKRCKRERIILKKTKPTKWTKCLLFSSMPQCLKEPYFHFLWNVSSHMIALLYSNFLKKLVGFLGIVTCLLLIKWSFWKPPRPSRHDFERLSTFRCCWLFFHTLDPRINNGQTKTKNIWIFPPKIKLQCLVRKWNFFCIFGTFVTYFYCCYLATPQFGFKILSFPKQRKNPSKTQNLKKKDVNFCCWRIRL